MCLWLRWVFVAQGPSPFVVNREKVKGRLLSRFCAKASHRGGFSCCRAQAPERRSSSCSTACEIFPDQVLNLCPLHQQVDSQPLDHQGSPRPFIISTHAGVVCTLLFKRANIKGICQYTKIVTVIAFNQWSPFNPLFLFTYFGNFPQWKQFIFITGKNLKRLKS